MAYTTACTNVQALIQVITVSPLVFVFQLLTFWPAAVVSYGDICKISPNIISGM